MKKIVGFLMMIILVGTCLSGCGEQKKEPETVQPESKATSAEDDKDDTESAQVEEKGAEETGPITVPDMETPEEYLHNSLGLTGVSFDTIQLSETDIQKIKDGKYTCAILSHTSGDDFSAAHIAGIEAACEEFGIEVIAVTDAKFKAEQQAIDLENVLALNPDIIVASPVDISTMGNLFKDAYHSGVQISYSDVVPEGLTEDDFTGVASADVYGNGVEAAKIMAEKLNGEGKVAVFYWTNPAPSTTYRVQGFKDYIEKNFPKIEIVTEEGFTDANKVSEIADAVFAKFPDLDGAFAVWDIPAEGVVASAKSRGLNDFVVTTVDLGTNAARIMAEDGMIKGLGAQQPFATGKAELTMAAMACAGLEHPKFVLLDPIAVTRENLADAWKQVYNTDLPGEVQSILDNKK